MSRLDSLTPSRARSRTASPSPAPSPGPSPSQTTETTHHRMLKLVLAEVRKILKTWDELIILDGFKAAKGCIDESTEMDNILLVDRPERPEIVPHLSALYAHRAQLSQTLKKLDNNLFKLTALVDQADKILFAAYQREGNDFVFLEPLWLTWTLEQFVNSLSDQISVHNLHLAQLTSLANILLDSTTNFDDAKLTLEHWRDISLGGERFNAARDWEELIELELMARKEEEEDSDELPVARGKKKGKR
ncbi:hypothetical protein IAU60_002751 [Kwoniella sp. DSM 27419]